MKMNWKVYKALMILPLSLSLTACLSPVKITPVTMYVIEQLPKNIPQKHKRAKTVLVMPPDSVAFYDSTGMVYSPQPYQLAYYVQNRWAMTPSQMFQPLIVQTLQKTKHFKAVVTPPFVGNYDYVLNTRIIKLQQNCYCCPIFTLKIRTELTKMRTNRLIFAKNFSFRQRMAKCSPCDEALVANFVTAKFLRKLAAGILRKT